MLQRKNNWMTNWITLNKEGNSTDAYLINKITPGRSGVFRAIISDPRFFSTQYEIPVVGSNTHL